MWLGEALTYAKRGWPCILLYGTTDGVCNCDKGRSCQNTGKHPVLNHSQKDATTDPRVLERWYESNAGEHRNLGILTGTVSNTLVIDIDPRNGGDETIQALQEENGPFPVTLTCDTGGGGTHLYFRPPEGSVVFTTSGLKGVDVKSTSKSGRLPGYVVTPPSVTKGEYRWRNPELPLATCPQWFLDRLMLEEIGGETFSTEDILEGQRHNYLLSRAGKLRHDGLSAETILQALRTENYSKCRPPLPDSEVDEIARGILRYDSPTFHLNDIGNAKRLVYKFGKQLIHCYQQKKWYIWDGRCWVPDGLGQVQQFAKSTVEWMHEDALIKGGDLGAALRKHATQSGRSERIGAMVEMARSEREITVLPDSLDAYPTILNCANGTLDLETGKLNNHDKKQLLTKICPTNYLPEARSEIWEEFLKTSTNEDEELQTFLQRISGYALSGLTVEESIFFVHGPGGTGKSTFFETIKSVMGGDYCKTASFATFIRNKSGSGGGGGARPDLARLPGARLVTAVEVSEGKEFATDILKVSTGGDKITTRDLYQSEFEFTPQYKIWLAANAKPHVREDDSGIWRRLLLIPFTHVVHTPNIRLKDELRSSKKDKEGILAWMVKGFLDWQKYRWTVPTVVKKETTAYRNEMDSFAAWLDDCTQKVPDAPPIPLNALWDSYDNWMKKQPPVVRESRIDTMKNFAAELQKRGFLAKVEPYNGRVSKVYYGISPIY